MCSARLAFLLISLLSLVAFGQGPAADSETSQKRAQEILKQCRESIGGEANLTMIKSLQATGHFRAIDGARETQGELKVELLMPDKFMRAVSLSPESPSGSKEATRLEIVNGDEVRIDRMETASPEIRAAMQRQVRSDFNQFLVAVLLAPAGISPFNYDYQREMKAKEGKFDLLSVKGPDGFAVWLLVDQKTHRPSMLGYLALPPLGSDDRQLSQDETGEPMMINYQYYFTEYKQVGNIWLPHHLTKTADGRVIEEWKINRYKLNPELKPARFDKKR